MQKIFQDNTRTVGIRMEQEAAPGLVIQGGSNVRHLSSGHKFTLDKHFDANGARCGLRYTHAPHDRGFSLGFRVAAERVR